MGKLLANCALLEGRNVICLPAYGAEVRGGTASCGVTISDEEIGSPYADRCDILVVMNQPSLVRFLPRLKKPGRLFANSSLISDAGGAKAFPFTQMAIDLGSVKVANTVALGCLCQHTGLVKISTLFSALEQVPLKPEIIAMNKEAVRQGSRLA